MVWIKKFFIVFLVVFEGMAFSLPYLGDMLDVTQTPRSSQLVVCLGGGTIERLEKSVALMEQGYVSSKKLLLLGESWYNHPFIKKNYPDLDVIIEELPKNTAEEIVFIKTYMITNGYQTALIVTDPPHSGRVSLLNTLLSVEGDEELSIRIISSDVSWWDKTYYRNVHASIAVMHESMACAYSLLVYGVFKKVGMLGTFEKWKQYIKSRMING